MSLLPWGICSGEISLFWWNSNWEYRFESNRQCLQKHSVDQKTDGNRTCHRLGPCAYAQNKLCFWKILCLCLIHEASLTWNIFSSPKFTFWFHFSLYPTLPRVEDCILKSLCVLPLTWLPESFLLFDLHNHPDCCVTKPYRSASSKPHSLQDNLPRSAHRIPHIRRYKSVSTEIPDIMFLRWSNTTCLSTFFASQKLKQQQQQLGIQH